MTKLYPSLCKSERYEHALRALIRGHDLDARVAQSQRDADQLAVDPEFRGQPGCVCEGVVLPGGLHHQVRGPDSKVAPNRIDRRAEEPDLEYFSFETGRRPRLAEDLEDQVPQVFPLVLVEGAVRGGLGARQAFEDAVQLL